jgi:flavin reductase (DIM6/NTAB) family NADH-FMN oxidoreductase RutF
MRTRLRQCNQGRVTPRQCDQRSDAETAHSSPVEEYQGIWPSILYFGTPVALVTTRPDGEFFRIVETHVQRVHTSSSIVKPATNHIDPQGWSPLLYVFRHYFGTGEEIGRSFRAED